jgi:hypothetical protein
VIHSSNDEAAMKHTALLAAEAHDCDHAAELTSTKHEVAVQLLSGALWLVFTTSLW